MQRAVALGLDCVQVFTANQRQWNPRGLQESDVAEWNAQMKAAGWSDPDEHRAVSHNSYLANMASPSAVARKKSVVLQRSELERCERLGIRLCVMHPGAHLGSKRPTTQPNDLQSGPNKEELAALKRLAACLDALHAQLSGYNVITCLENTVGAGTNLGYDFRHLALVRDMVQQPERIGFCIDTCHAVAAGYCMNTPALAKAVVQRLCRELGGGHVHVFHLNDSIGVCGSRRDRHTHIGQGTCGDSAFRAVLRHAEWARVPMIMETPKEGECDREPRDVVNARRLRSLAGRASVATRSRSAPRRSVRGHCVALGLLLGISVLLLPACATRSLEEIRGEDTQPIATQGGPLRPSADETSSLANAQARADHGDYDSALTMFREILRDNPKLPDAWVGIGDAHSSLQEWQNAEGAYANATNLDPASFEAYYGRGKALQVLNRLVDAIRCYHRALLVRPDDFDANLNLATAYLQLDQGASAVVFAEKAVKLKSESGAARINLGVAYERVNRAADAVQQYEMAAELMEPTPQLLMNLLNAYAHSKRYQEAVNTANILVRVAPTANSWERLGWTYFRLGDYTRSLESYRESVRVDAAHWPGWNGVGVNLLNGWIQGGRKDSGAAEHARAAFRKSLQVNPDQVKVQKLLSTYSL